MCLIYHWTDEHVLKMPIKRFFALLNAGRELKHQEQYFKYAELTDIAIVASCDSEYHKKLKEYYLNRAMPEKYNQNVIPADDPNAAALLEDIFNKVK